jgi:hypothetical protein
VQWEARPRARHDPAEWSSSEGADGRRLGQRWERR